MSLPVFNNWVMPSTVKSSNRSLPERRVRPRQKGSDKSRSALDTSENDAVDPVAPAIATADTSLDLDLLRDTSGANSHGEKLGDDKRSHDKRRRLKKEPAARDLPALKQLQSIMELVAHANREDISPEDAGRLNQALAVSVQEISSKTRDQLRRLILQGPDSEQMPGEVSDDIETIAGPIDKLKAVTRRELRSRHNAESPKTQMGRVVVQLKALPILIFANKFAVQEHRRECVAALRMMLKCEY